MSKIKSATFPIAQTSGVSPAGHVLAEKPPRHGLCWGRPDTCTPGQGPHSGQHLHPGPTTELTCTCKGSLSKSGPVTSTRDHMEELHTCCTYIRTWAYFMRETSQPTTAFFFQCQPWCLTPKGCSNYMCLITSVATLSRQKRRDEGLFWNRLWFTSDMSPKVNSRKRSSAQNHQYFFDESFSISKQIVQYLVASYRVRWSLSPSRGKKPTISPRKILKWNSAFGHSYPKDIIMNDFSPAHKNSPRVGTTLWRYIRIYQQYWSELRRYVPFDPVILVLGIYSINILSCMENYRFFLFVCLSLFGYPAAWAFS